MNAKLYNPHGSDGTVNGTFFIPLNPAFITHTVQMEPALSTLDSIAEKYLSNPHGSDGTPEEVRELISHNKLSNPHGSDGTDPKTIYNYAKSSFLTHTVQMEPI